ncbi:amidohydrolase family protein [Pseudalkalibacillus caeni]|uniref:Amidohydrolase n=1 Tax=Exobacillus caeni TaxID=2574798 RepID=A0A5R9F2T7_9BACL|nr:amidohydrolase family protein [Pseudalkalibacillus caeni]TLS36809.1 amidohydrolase [Pseudalkalibacillus caeni]
MNVKILLPISLISLLLLGSCSLETSKNDDIKVIPHTEYTPDDSMIEKFKEMKQSADADQALHQTYKDLPIIDVHNHDASAMPLDYWNEYGIDRTVLFGNISEPAAQVTDSASWNHYIDHTDRIFPSFAGIPLDEENNMEFKKVMKEHLEQGYLNIGEIVAASTYSRLTSNLKWKAENPNWGNLPGLYELAEKYKVPVLLHIDPPKGAPIAHLKRALADHPKTIFIFGHGNVFNSPANLAKLLKNHDNLYIDFYAGFTRYDKGSSHKLEDFVPIIEKYPDRFMLGSDSGSGIGLSDGYEAMYEVLNMLAPETAVKVAYQNYERLIEIQPPTKTQIREIGKLTDKLNIQDKKYKLNKREANELLFQLQKQVENQTSAE